MVVAGVVLALILLLRFGPDVPFLRLVRIAVVETPARWLPQLERHQIIALLVIAALIVAGGRLILLFAPELVTLFAINLGIYIDATAISALLGVATVVRRVSPTIRVEIEGWRTFVTRTLIQRVREVRTRPVATKLPADNDDEPVGPALARAA